MPKRNLRGWASFRRSRRQENSKKASDQGLVRRFLHQDGPQRMEGAVLGSGGALAACKEENSSSVLGLIRPHKRALMVLTPHPKSAQLYSLLLERGAKRARTHHRSISGPCSPGPRQRGGNPSSPRPCRGRWALATGTPSCRRPRVWHRGGYLGARPVPFRNDHRHRSTARFSQRVKDEAPPHPLLASVVTHAADFSELPFPRESLDLIWSEGDLHLGFAAGLAAWRPFRRRGLPAVTELTWLTDFRAEPLQAF